MSCRCQSATFMFVVQLQRCVLRIQMRPILQQGHMNTHSTGVCTASTSRGCQGCICAVATDLTLMYPWQKHISTVSFMMGSRPAWCTAMPRRIRSRSRRICVCGGGGQGGQGGGQKTERQKVAGGVDTGSTIGDAQGPAASSGSWVLWALSGLYEGCNVNPCEGVDAGFVMVCTACRV
jgi:hypothetical protein